MKTKKIILALIAGWCLIGCATGTKGRQIKAHPDDTAARSAALVLLDMNNVQIFGEYMFGNQIPLEKLEWKEE